ncbi:hypothetical protein [Streptomyces sp. LS1784]|uniref:hypothetical protein n=1 Tax=Streptomyces sp. LS1784 TaxID=2851533 RepID=UPI001CCC8775|nr:hypothetical protein [Streptomyces sp. LS1784]
MTTNLAVLATCSPLILWWACRIATLRRLPMPDLPDDIGITPATGTRPPILWARYGNTIEYYAVRPAVHGTQPDHEEPQP